MLFAQPPAPKDQCLHGVMLGRARVRDPLTGTTKDTGMLLFRITSSDLAPRLLAGDFAEIDPAKLKPEPGKFALFKAPDSAVLQLRRAGPGTAHLEVVGTLRSFHGGADDL